MNMFKTVYGARRYAIIRGAVNWRSSSRYVHIRRSKQNIRRADPFSRGSEAPKVIWPTHVLESAYKTGLIPLTASSSESLLSEFVQLAKAGPPSISTVQPLIQRFSIDARTLFWLSWILQKGISDNKKLGSIAKLLQITAAALQDEYASLALVESALRANKPRHPDISDAVKNLTHLSNQGNVFAKERLAVLSEMQGDKQHALSLSKEVLRSKTIPSLNQHFVLDPSFSAWKTVGRIQESIGPSSSDSLDAVEYGAKTLDDPDAYYNLAMRSDQFDDSQRLAYLLKAAASGDARAALRVADWYLKQATGGLQRETLSNNSENILESVSKVSPARFSLTLASEWYELALRSPKHSVETVKEAAGSGAVIVLGLLKDSNRCADLAAEYPEMRWAQKLQV